MAASRSEARGGAPSLGRRASSPHVASGKRGVQLSPAASRGPRPVRAPGAGVRDLRLDNLKGVLILLVVLCHSLWGYRTLDEVAPFLKLVYVFHMPAFIFVSGYLTKDSRTVPARPILTLLAVYAVANGLMIAAVVGRGGGLTLLQPYYSCWYLLSLACWRLAVPLISRWRGALPASIILSLSVGWCAEIDNVLAVGRTIAFAPFFIAGFLCRKHAVLDRLRSRLPGGRSLLCGGAILLAGLVVAHAGVGVLGVTLSDELMEPYRQGFAAGAPVRLFLMASATAIVLGAMLCFPSRCIPGITKLGRNSLTVYAFHRIPTLVLLMLLPASGFSPLYWLAAAVATAAILWVLSLDAVEHGFRRLAGEAAGIALGERGERARSMLLWGLVAVLVVLFAIASVRGA